MLTIRGVWSRFIPALTLNRSAGHHSQWRTIENLKTPDLRSTSTRKGGGVPNLRYCRYFGETQNLEHSCVCKVETNRCRCIHCTDISWCWFVCFLCRSVQRSHLQFRPPLLTSALQITTFQVNHHAHPFVFVINIVELSLAYLHLFTLFKVGIL